jgi:thiamine-phosphate pyrophosphorylase
VGTHLLDFSLCLVTDRSQTRGRPLLDVVDECLTAGLRAVQLREKDLSTRELHTLARSLRTLTQRAGATLFINDRVDVALAVEADGVHLAGHSLPAAVVRSTFRSIPLIGVSTHSIEEARAAEAGGADFVLFGPIYDTPSKRLWGAPQGVEPLAKVSAELSIPVFAIGGITPERVAEVRSAGARGVAVISAILSADHPGQATKAFIQSLGVN